MDYELAKQLKEAGFPIKEKVIYSVQSETERHEIKEWFPTLSELIDACGDRFEELSKMTHKVNPKQRWGAHAYPCEECGYGGLHSGYGSTPEEAVARLWLSLNAPQNNEIKEK